MTKGNVSKLRKIDGLVLTDVPDGVFVHDSKGTTVHLLNPVAAAILILCDGSQSEVELACLLMEQYGLPEPPIADVAACLDQLRSQGLVQNVGSSTTPKRNVLPDEEVARLQKDFAQAASDAANVSCPDRFEGKGIVIAAGGARFFTCAWIAVRMLRDHLRTELPIEVWHLGPEEMSPAMRSLLEEQNVVTVDALTRPEADGTRKLGGWELKAFALRNCRFAEVILLDADNVPLIDPACLFDTEAYLSTGAVFWPDTVYLSEDSGAWSACGVDFRKTPSIESGQLVADKRRHWNAIDLAWFLNARSDTVYRMLYGDKDTYLMSWLRLGSPFTLVAHRARLMDGWIGQHHPEGHLMFQHRNLRKWILNGANPVLDGFQEDARCRRYLQELEGLWNGRIFLPPPLGDAGMAFERKMISMRWFVYELVGDRRWTMELLPGNRIGKGFDLHEAHWWVAEDDRGLAVCIGEDEGVFVRLEAVADGQWRGRWTSARALPVILKASVPRADLDQDGAELAKRWTVLPDFYRPLDESP